MFKWLHKVLFGSIDEAIEKARYVRAVENDKQRTEMQKLNQTFKILIGEGSIELVIKNIKGVVENQK